MTNVTVDAIVETFLAEITEVCRKYEFTIDIGDGEFRVYLASDNGVGGLACVHWSEKRNALLAYKLGDREIDKWWLE